MLKIVDVHPSHVPNGEYIVLQNQGTATASLKGCALCAETYLDSDPSEAARDMYVFWHDVAIKPYGRVVLFTGEGYDGWQPTTDGRHCFVAYWSRAEPVWLDHHYVHLLRMESSHKVVQPDQYTAV